MSKLRSKEPLWGNNRREDRRAGGAYLAHLGVKPARNGSSDRRDKKAFQKDEQGRPLAGAYERRVVRKWWAEEAAYMDEQMLHNAY